jgi:hypothetical protein
MMSHICRLNSTMAAETESNRIVAAAEGSAARGRYQYWLLSPCYVGSCHDCECRQAMKDKPRINLYHKHMYGRMLEMQKTSLTSEQAEV